MDMAEVAVQAGNGACQVVLGVTGSRVWGLGLAIAWQCTCAGVYATLSEADCHLDGSVLDQCSFLPPAAAPQSRQMTVVTHHETYRVAHAHST